jgi:transcriptional regulator with XRE-family HTH domain
MDRYRLEYEMKRRGVTVKEMCDHLQISRSAFYRKTRGMSEFTLSEIKEIVDYLKLESPMGVFFSSESVAKDTLTM